MAWWIAEPGLFAEPGIEDSTTFIHSPVFRRATSSRAGYVGDDLWCLIDYYTPSRAALAKWVISDWPIPGIKIGSDKLAPQQGFYRMSPVFCSDNSVLFYSAYRSTWIYRTDGDGIQEPLAALGLDGETWEGDGWFEFPGMTEDLFRTLPWTMSPKGTKINEGSASVTAEIWWPRWIGPMRSSGPCGTYEAAADESLVPQIRHVGLPVWRGWVGGVRRKFVRSLTKASGRWSYGDLVWSNRRSAYVLGDLESEWWETALPPTVDDGATLVSMKRGESGLVVKGDWGDAVLIFDGYEMGESTTEHAIAEAVAWRGV